MLGERDEGDVPQTIIALGRQDTDPDDLEAQLRYVQRAWGAVLGDAAAFAELIVDGHHVAGPSVRAAFAAKGARLMLITDAIRAPHKR